MIKPSIGRVVWFWPAGVNPPPSGDAQPYAAIVAHVHADDRVNLAYFNAHGVASHAENVLLLQDNAKRPTENFAEWMPYQIGQAKKHEAEDQRAPADKSSDPPKFEPHEELPKAVEPKPRAPLNFSSDD